MRDGLPSARVRSDRLRYLTEDPAYTALIRYLEGAVKMNKDEMKEMHVEFYDRNETTYIKIWVVTMDGAKVVLADTECDFVHMKIVHNRKLDN